MGNSMSESERKEAEFGKKIYDIVHEIYPESCENITGMLLEAEYDELERLLTTAGREELEARIHLAAKHPISTSSNLISEREKNELQANNMDNESDKGTNIHSMPIDAKELTDSDNSGLPNRRELSPSGSSAICSRILEKKQALGEKIYSLVEKYQPCDADVLTGILLEMDIQSLEQLVNDKDLLEQKLDEALAVLQNTSGESQNSKSELVLPVNTHPDKAEIGERLFELVSTFNSEQADKITGMLLEMDLQDVEVIVKNQAALEEKINQASMALSSHLKQPDTSSLTEENPDKTLYGEQLYCLISELYPEQADKITGMLLELDVSTLQLLIKDSVALRDKALHAARALTNTNSCKEISQYPVEVDRETEDKRISESETRNSLVEQLCNIIKEWYPTEARKITEMIMYSEKDCATLETLILNKQLLKEKINGMLGVDQRTPNETPNRESTKSEGDITTEELGEKLFEIVEETCPQNADKITGMLLEMSVKEIKNLLNNHQELEEKIRLAEKALF